VSTLHCFFGIRDFILRFLPCNFICLVVNPLCQLLCVAQWLACWVVTQPIRVRVPACAIFFIIMFIMATMGTITFHSLSSFFCFLSSFAHIPERRSAVSFSTRKTENTPGILQQWSFTYYQYRMKHITLRWQVCRIPDGTRRKCNQSKKIIGNWLNLYCFLC
jgi:hypothetical protein